MTLSGEVSEWLFKIGFWEELNGRYETDFAQYEEEVLLSQMADDVANSIDNIGRGLADDGGEVSFRYGWNQNEEELICCVSIKVLIEELRKLVNFFGLAAKHHLDVYCQL